MNYRFLKYFLALTIPFFAYLSFNGNGIITYAPVIEAFLIIPVLELFFKPNSKNLSDAEEEMSKDDRSYDIVLYLLVPIIYFLIWEFLGSMSENLSTSDTVGRILSMGLICGGLGINVAHELGHRKSFFSRTCSKLLLMPSQYMHFYIEHNFGHHVNVGTEEDPATAKYKQSLYSFWITSVIGQYIGAWKLQLKLLKISKHKFFSIKNDMMFYVIFQLMFIYLIYFNYGITVTIYSLIISVISFLFLETINYIEHYGLSRKKDENGRYERVKTVHSWNSNHVVGRLVLYELTRHSDHHFISSKKYQVLESIDESPQLPYGYPTSILLSMVPPLWFKIMNPRVESYQN